VATGDDRPAGDGRNRRCFTVLWTTSGRERRSAQMTEAEAQKFVERLAREKAEGVRVDTTDAPAYVRYRPS
jgi:hypothetical protein